MLRARITFTQRNTEPLPEHPGVFDRPVYEPFVKARAAHAEKAAGLAVERVRAALPGSILTLGLDHVLHGPYPLRSGGASYRISITADIPEEG